MASVLFTPNKNTFKAGDTIKLKVYNTTILYVVDEWEGWYWTSGWGGREGIYNSNGENVVGLFTLVDTVVLLDESTSIGDGGNLSRSIIEYTYSIGENTPVGDYFIHSYSSEEFLPPPEG